MPIAAIGMIIVGSETVGVVGGLMMASGALSFAGYATDNEKLKMAGAVTGLVAGGYGLMGGAAAGEGVAMDAFANDAGTAAVNSSGIATQATEGAALDSFANDAGTAGSTGDSLGNSASGSFDPSANYDGMNTSAMPGAPPTTSNPLSLESPAPTPTPTPSSGLVGSNMNQPAGGFQDVYSAADMQPPAPGSAAAKMLAGDETNLDKIKALWEGFKKLDPQTRNIIGQAVAKGLGSVSDFVGPKADFMRAQTGVNKAQTDILAQQLANINTVGTVKSQTYTIQPRAPA